MQTRTTERLDGGTRAADPRKRHYVERVGPGAYSRVALCGTRVEEIVREHNGGGAGVAKRLILSASQFSDALDCQRKWWWKRVARLPDSAPNDPKTLARTLGDVLHEVAERYLRADELGRDPETGLPVDLYPPGWTTTVSKFGADKGKKRTITVGEAEQVQKLVKAAIEQGVLTRTATGRTEARFDIPLKVGDRTVTVMGFRDYVPDRATVEDHKTVKVDKSPWRKTPLNLYRDVQMRTYGYSLIWEAVKNGEPPPARVTLTHNQFCKDPDNPVVRKTRACDKNAEEEGISRQELETWWSSTIEPLAAELLKVREIKEWHEVPGPAEGSDACNKYGGCPYQNICAGMWTPERYLKRLERKARALPSADCRSTTVVSTQRKDSTQGTGATMSFASKLAAKKARKKALSGGGSDPAPQAAAPEPKPAPEPEAPAARVAVKGDTPPWAAADCRACGGTGFSSRGAPCRICDAKAKKAGRLPSSAFEILTEEGVIVWSNGEIEGSVELVTEEVEAKETPQPAPKAEPKPEEPKPDSALAEAKAKAKKAVNPAPAKRGRGRPSKGFMLLIDCVPVKGIGKVGGGKGVIRLDEVIHRYGAAMAADMGVESFYDVNAFDRRDQLCKVAEVLAAEFGTDMVVASTCNVEERELLKALRPLAARVIVATSR